MRERGLRHFSFVAVMVFFVLGGFSSSPTLARAAGSLCHPTVANQGGGGGYGGRQAGISVFIQSSCETRAIFIGQVTDLAGNIIWQVQNRQFLLTGQTQNVGFTWLAADSVGTGPFLLHVLIYAEDGKSLLFESPSPSDYPFQVTLQPVCQYTISTSYQSANYTNSSRQVGAYLNYLTSCRNSDAAFSPVSVSMVYSLINASGRTIAESSLSDIALDGSLQSMQYAWIIPNSVRPGTYAVEVKFVGATNGTLYGQAQLGVVTVQ